MHPVQGQRPKDLETIEAILKDMNVTSYEPQVCDQLLEFMHGYTVNVLRDAQVYQAHREGEALELDDARLAIQSRVNNSFTQPPPRELMLELAAERNAQPLDVVPKKFGVLLPDEAFCLTNANYVLEPKKQ